jgi:predicted outer membrane repeat protein
LASEKIGVSARLVKEAHPMRALLLPGLLVCAIGASAFSETLYVSDAFGDDAYDGRCTVWDGGTCGPKRTIQAGIDAAAEADEVVIAPALYTGDGNRDLSFGGKNITVRGVDPEDPLMVAWTVLDCEGSEVDPHRAFVFHSGEGDTAVVAGLTIANGFAPADAPCTDSGGNGGGVAICDDTGPTLRHCVFRSCRAGSGGAIYGARTNGLIVEACTFVDNTSLHDGGAVYVHDGELTIRESTFEANEAGRDGGAVVQNGGQATITSSTFRGQWAGSSGGAIYAGGDCRISGSLFEENATGGRGGGVYVTGFGGTRVSRCTFLRNNAYAGGALATMRSAPFTDRCWFFDNMATTDGGAIQFGGGGVDVAPSVQSSMIAGNHADGDGGGIASDINSPYIGYCTFHANEAGNRGGAYWGDGSYATLNSCILWENEAPNGAQMAYRGEDLSVSYCDVQGGEAGVFLEPDSVIDWGDGNFSQPPLFVDPLGPDGDPMTAEDNDLHLLGISPCINRGDPAYDAIRTFDIDGDPRKLLGRVDVGADEATEHRIPDADEDGDVDLTDYSWFLGCFHGPNQPSIGFRCPVFDVDDDGDVDLLDYAYFLECFNGPNRDPLCR